MIISTAGLHRAPEMGATPEAWWAAVLFLMYWMKGNALGAVGRLIRAAAETGPAGIEIVLFIARGPSGQRRPLS